MARSLSQMASFSIVCAFETLAQVAESHRPIHTPTLITIPSLSSLYCVIMEFLILYFSTYTLI